MMQNNNEKILKFLGNGTSYYHYLNPATQDAVDRLTDQANKAYVLEQNEFAKQAVFTIQDAISKREERIASYEKAAQRTLALKEGEQRRAGYINGTILVYFILIFGVLVALGLIIAK